MHTAQAQTASPDALMQKIEAMANELARLQAEVAQLKSAQTKTEATALQASTQAQAASATAQATSTALAGSGLKLPGGTATVLTGYGEINYNRYTKNSAANQIDLRRSVLGVQHRFDDKTKFVGEFEWEHAVVSSGDRGEAAIEQAYVEHQLTPKLAVRGGLFLVPAGLINESHEPSAFYGVERNFVETAIIPSTWREVGAMLIGNTDNGITYKAGFATGFDLSKWDSKAGDGKESPLSSIHQEGQFAKAKNISLFGAVDWRGMPGLLVGASVFSGKAGHGALSGDADPSITLWDAHVRWTPGKWDLSAVYAAGSISGLGKYNTAFAGDPTPIPSKFDGGYVQVAYKLWSSGDYQLKPFARYERYNTAKSYEGFPAGLGRAADPYERIVTVGANFHVSPNVVVKTDYQVFAVNKDYNRFNVGLGWSF